MLFHGLARAITDLSAMLFSQHRAAVPYNNWNFHSTEQLSLGKYEKPLRGETKVDFSRPPMLFSLTEFREKTGHNERTAAGGEAAEGIAFTLTLNFLELLFSLHIELFFSFSST